MNNTTDIRPLRNGANQKGVRDHNERLILSVLQRNGPLPGSDIARRTQLSAQTVSVILRKLQADGLLTKGKPVKGKVGKPSIPMALNPEGALSLGFKLGRRSSELFLTNLFGKVLFEKRLTYDIALPQTIFTFLREGFAEAIDAIGPTRAARLCGIGIAAPFEIWKWDVSDPSAQSEFLSWKDISFKEELARFTDLPVFLVNDATSACWAEQVYGRGREFQNYAHFFVSTFIGGGIVLNNAVFEGPQGNAAAFGPIRIKDQAGQPRKLLDVASIHRLEKMVQAWGGDPRQLWHQPQDWSAFASDVDIWIDESAWAMADAITSICAVVDFETVIVDGYIPADVRARLVAAIRVHLSDQDSRGLIPPKITQGHMGGEARAIGAACVPIYAQHFLGARHGLAD